MRNIKTIDCCRICKARDLATVLDMGEQTLTGVFPRPGQPDPISAPITLAICGDCSFVQLRHTVDSSLMYREYWYRSGTNQTMRDHLKGIVEQVMAEVNLRPGDHVLDIGCNDGTLLKAYEAPGLKRIGVDPSDAIKAIDDPGITAINDFFSADSLHAILAGKKARVITSISMFYDLDDPDAFVADIASVLSDDGLWVVEMNYVGTMVETLGYDMIGHEHIAYYTLQTFERVIHAHGLYVNDIGFNPINGGSIRFLCSFTKRETAVVADTRAREKHQALGEIATYRAFGARIEHFKQVLVETLHGIRAQGKKIGIYGASTRGNTILQHCGLTHDLLFAAADRNPGKWGLESPGSRIPIMSEEAVRALRPDYMLVLPYYFLPEFLQREKSYLQQGGAFIVPLPQLRIITWKIGDSEPVEHML